MATTGVGRYVLAGEKSVLGRQGPIQEMNTIYAPIGNVAMADWTTHDCLEQA